MNKQKPVYGVRRNDYRKIKSMNREQLSGYLERVWCRGYEAGIKKAAENNGGPANE